MAATLSEAQTQLTAALSSLEAARKGSFSAGDFSSTPPSLDEIQKQVDYWRKQVSLLSVTKQRGMGKRVIWTS